MEALTFRDFRGGWITAQDSADLQGWRRFENIETHKLASGGTAVRMRHPMGDYDTENFFESVEWPSAYTRPSIDLPQDAGYALHKVYRWTAGMFRYTENTILVYRSLSLNPAARPSDQYDWRIYSNAPYMAFAAYMQYGAGPVLAGPTIPSAWTLLEDFTAPICRVSFRGGDAYIVFGSRYDYRIYTQISGPEGYRTLFTGSSVTVGGNYQNLSTQLGGTPSLGTLAEVNQGWLYDKARLWQRWADALDGWTATVTPKADAQYALGLVDDPSGELIVMIAPVYDLLTGEIGVPYMVSQPMNSLGVKAEQLYFEIVITIPDKFFNYRITEFAVYLQTKSLKNTASNEAKYYGSIRVAEDFSRAPGTLTSITFRVSRENSTLAQRTWSTDTAISQSLGRDVPRMSGTSGSQRVSTSTDCDNAENEITLKPHGIIHHKNIAYAWAVDGDEGGVRIRMSAQSGSRYHPNVFDITNVMWKPDAKHPVTALIGHDDRLLELHETGVYYADTPEYPLHQGTYLYSADAIGSGLPLAFYDTLARGNGGVFWANYEGVWVFRNDRPENLLIGRIWDEWLALSDAQKILCVGGYNEHDQEYWLAIHPIAYGPPSMYWVWYDGDLEMRHWRKVVPPTTGATVHTLGFFSDVKHRFSSCGPTLGGSAAKCVQMVRTDLTKDYGTQAITAALESQQRGVRSGLLTADAVQVVREASDNATVKVYRGTGQTASATIVVGAHEEAVRFRALTAGTIRLGVEMQWTSGSRPTLMEVSMFYSSARRRIR